MFIYDAMVIRSRTRGNKKPSAHHLLRARWNRGSYFAGVVSVIHCGLRPALRMCVGGQRAARQRLVVVAATLLRRQFSDCRHAPAALFQHGVDERTLRFLALALRVSFLIVIPFVFIRVHSWLACPPMPVALKTRQTFF